MERYLKETLFTLGGSDITLVDVILFVLLIAASWIVSRILERATMRTMRLRRVTDEGAVYAAGRIIHYLVLLLGFALAFNFVGVNPSALFAAGAVFAAVVGFALQNISQNFFAGFILLFERSITTGDVLEVEGQLLRVSAIGIRSTVARTLNDEEVIIPNSTLIQTSVKNFTLGDQLYRLRTLVGVLYSSDLKLVRQTLEGATARLTWRVSSRAPRILLKEFGDSSVVYDVSVWIDDPWQRQVRMSDLNEAIWWALKEAGIIIAFPQLDVHFDPVFLESLRRQEG